MRFSMHRLLAVAHKEVLQLRRDARSLTMAFFVPALMVVFFGAIISFDVKEIKLAVLDEDRSQPSRELVASFVATGRFVITDHLSRLQEVAPLLDRGAIRLALVIPPGFARRLASGERAPVQAIIDGADANTAGITANYAAAIVTAFSAKAATGGVPVVAPVTLQARVWYNETLESAPMIVPGLVAVIMMVIATMLTSLTIAREWERGTMEQLAATPVHPTEVILGKLLPYLAIGLIDVVGTVLIGLYFFHVPFRGSPVLLGVMATLFIVGSLSLGMFISASMKSQLMASQLSQLATFLPAFLLSGLMFDLNSIPWVLRAISTLVPARYFITVMRGIFLKDVGLSVLWGQGLAMVLYAVAGLWLAGRAFKKEIG